MTDTNVCVFSLRRQHLLVHVARAHGYSKVMLGDSCTRVAVKLLTNISLGRGAHLAQDTVRSGLHSALFGRLRNKLCLSGQGFSDSRFGDVVLVRPMRDYSAKEIAYYNHMFNVPSVFMPGLETKVT